MVAGQLGELPGREQGVLVLGLGLGRGEAGKHSWRGAVWPGADEFLWIWDFPLLQGLGPSRHRPVSLTARDM